MVVPVPITILDVLKNLFPPQGSTEPRYTIWPDQKYSGTDTDYRLLPLQPFDLFAATAHLIELSGAYHHFVAGGDNQDAGANTGARDCGRGRHAC